MLVRALISFASSDGGHAEGEVFHAAPFDAREWLRAGLVAREEPTLEVATVAPPEVAVAVARKGRR